MSTKTFVPAVWSSGLLSYFRQNSVVDQFVNRDYQGLIQNLGDTVKINFLKDLTVTDYKPDEKMTYDKLETVGKNLIIDHYKKVAFEVDDIDAVQAAGSLVGTAIDTVGRELNSDWDKSIFDYILSNISAENAIGSDTSPETISDPNDLVDLVVDLMVKADENNVPVEGRVFGVSPAIAGMILKSDKRNMSPKFEEFVNRGYIGGLYGAEFFKTNNITKSTNSNERILLTHPAATTVADQIVNMEAFRSQESFADRVRGLHVYGRECIRPEAVLGAYVKIGASA